VSTSARARARQGAGVYPWSAIVGQPTLKRALLLCALDPAIGGVLVKGPRGVGKTTLARALSELLTGPFVELPLGASEERVTGTLDLDAALREQRVAFSPGLLARAHEGVLYVDEVNLLPDGLVDLLLDAAASGRNVVERDGVSHAHPARFVLIGTMNPEEGELRPQLLDRFGLCVTSEPQIPPADRALIVRRRLEFDRDPEAFMAEFQAAQDQLRERCAQARARLATMPLDSVWLDRVSELCHAAHVEGVRADLALLRAARAHAAWHERDVICEVDIEAVSELALVHRRSRKPEPPRGGPASGGTRQDAGSSQRGGAETQAARGDAETPRTGGQQESTGRITDRGAGESGPSQAPAVAAGSGAGPGNREPNRGPELTQDSRGQRGGAVPMPARPVRAAQATLTAGFVASLQHSPARPPRLGPRLTHGSLRRNAAPLAAARGRRSSAQAHTQAGAIDWCASLLRDPRPRRSSQLVRRQRHQPASPLWVLVLDCSASMLRTGALSASKGLAHAIEAEAARAGARVVLISFRGSAAQLELSSRAGRAVVAERIAALGGGGGTPLRRALEAALGCCRQQPEPGRGPRQRILLLTDGRSRDPVADLPLTVRGVEWWVVDCERGPVRLGLAAPLAAALGARYQGLDQAVSEPRPLG